jgi:serine/threonine-protein kinase/endoribonuclease IRE1
MMRRPPGEGNVVKRSVLIALAILLIPWIVEAQQQHRQPIRRHESPHEALGSDAVHTLEATRLAQHAPRLETPLTSERRKNTLSVNHKVQEDKNDASAIATLAPAKSAVRAPPPRRSSIETAGLSSPQLARSLEDWEVEDFVLLATVDGKLYARDRKTGKERWALEVDKPMVETTYYRRNRSAIEEDYREYDDYLWIVEPSRDGSLFVYVPAGPDPGLVNTGLTIKKLVEEMSPHSGEEPPVVYTGDKKTTMVTLDARSGRVLKWFGSAGALVNDETCRSTGLLLEDHEECSTTGTLTLGRVEYTVGIQGKDGRPIATMKYSEWVPNNYDSDLFRQYRTTLDSKYVYSSHDGSIFGYDHALTEEPGRLFKQKFSSPVVRVFDVARPWGSANKDPELVVLPQPVPPADDEHLASMRNSRIFLNQTEGGSWYAMSGNTYPLVINGPEHAQCDNRDWWRHGPHWEDMSEAQLSKVLVGLHTMDSVKPERLLTISAPVETEEDSPADEVIAVESDVTSVLGQVKQLPQSAWKSIFDFVRNPVMKFVLLALLALYYKDMLAWLRTGRFKSKLQPILEPLVSIPDASETIKVDTVAETLPAQEDGVKAIDVVVPQAAAAESTPSTNDVVAQSIPELTPSKEKTTSDTPKPSAMEKVVGEIVDAPQPAPTPEKKKASRGRRGGVKHRKGRHTSEGPTTKRPAPTVEDSVREAQKLGEASKGMEPDLQTIANGVTEVSGPILRMGSMTCNMDKLIGTGSNGTMVFEGTFDGRAVAVKRMLIQFFDIASQETKLLRESDDHPNGTVLLNY